MAKTATEVMQEVIFSVVLDAIGALKTASKGLPNTLLRDINSIHANTTFADLPPELQAMISGSVRGAFTRLMREGYSVSISSAQAVQPRNAPPRHEGSGHPPRPTRPPGKRSGPDGRKPPRPGGRPGHKPGPRGR